MSKKQVTTHQTGPVNVLFMAAARPFLNDKTGKKEYSVKIEGSVDGALYSHLKEINPAKIVTTKKVDGIMQPLEGGLFRTNFYTEFEPMVTDNEGQELKGNDIPFFDGRIDKATVNVTYKVIDYGNAKIVRLAGIQLLSLDLAPRQEAEGSVEDLKNTIKNLG